jgi:ubiquinone/menaquinone biosynthesis C-methylase UbiE
MLFTGHSYNRVHEGMDTSDLKALVTDRKKVLQCSLLFLFLTISIIGLVHSIYYYEHTYVWFSSNLPSPTEVTHWNESKRFNTLYKLSRWESFESGLQFNQFVRDQIMPLGKQPTDVFHFLEIGVGVGAFALEVLKMYPNSTGSGIDVVPRAIAIAEVVVPHDRMLVKVGDMRKVDYGAKEFDVVFVPGALCYLLSMDEVRLAVSEFYRVLKPGGDMCISMLANETSPLGSCNTRISKHFWTNDMASKFTLFKMDAMDDWHLPHSNGRYSVCLKRLA